MLSLHVQINFRKGHNRARPKIVILSQNKHGWTTSVLDLRRAVIRIWRKMRFLNHSSSLIDREIERFNCILHYKENTIVSFPIAVFCLFNYYVLLACCKVCWGVARVVDWDGLITWELIWRGGIFLLTKRRLLSSYIVLMEIGEKRNKTPIWQVGPFCMIWNFKKITHFRFSLSKNNMALTLIFSACIVLKVMVHIYLFKGLKVNDQLKSFT